MHFFRLDPLRSQVSARETFTKRRSASLAYNITKSDAGCGFRPLYIYAFIVSVIDIVSLCSLSLSPGRALSALGRGPSCGVAGPSPLYFNNLPSINSPSGRNGGLYQHTEQRGYFPLFNLRAEDPAESRLVGGLGLCVRRLGPVELLADVARARLELARLQQVGLRLAELQQL